MKKILIGSDPYETRVAIVEDSQVVETYVERAERRSLLGNVYLGRVDNVLPGMEAAFVDVGLEKNGFLYVDEIVLPELDDKARRQKRIQELIRPRQELLVQVVKDPMGTKGARLTMELSFAGRFLVYAPEGTGYGVSKRLDDAERERLRDLVKQLKPKDGGGLIVRTAARGADLPELERDLRLLEQLWDDIRASAKQGGAPRLVHQEVDLALEMVRDDLRVDVDEVVTDDEETYERIRGYVEQHSPEMLDRVKLHNAAAPLLRRYEVERAIESTMHRRVDLPSGGYLLFDYAEAFTIIDVNTGRFVGKSRLEDTILHNNLEAAREVVRQLRLRDIGGIIVIDFIDMASKKNRDAVIACLQEELKKDRSKVYLVSISPLGLVEMTRQNVTDGVREIMSARCPTCQGEGIVVSDETLAVDNLRQLRRHARLSASEAFLVELDPRVSARMVGAGGRRLQELEESTGKHFSLVGVDGVPRERCSVVREGKVEEIMAEAIPLKSGEELELEIAEPHMFQVADAVAYLPGGYRVVVAGAGPYLRESHRVRIERAGRLEAHAVLLDAEPVTEAQMLDMIDHRSDLLEPPRTTIDRIDLEERGRGRRTRKKPEKAGADGAAKKGEGGRKPAVATAAATTSEIGGDDADGEAGEDGDGTTTKRKRRRRGGRGRSKTGVAAGTSAEGGDDAEAVGDDEGGDEPEPGTAEGQRAADQRGDEGSDEDAAAKRRRRGRRGGRRHRKPGELAGVGGGDEPAPAAEPAAVASGEPPARTPRPRPTPRPAAPPAPREPRESREPRPLEPTLDDRPKGGLFKRLLGRE
jgi:ribonuclease G